jgi:hypothetical protein
LRWFQLAVFKRDASGQTVHTLHDDEQLPNRLRQSCRELSTHSMNFLSHASTQRLLLLFSFLSAMAFSSYIFVARWGIDRVY